MNDIEQSVTFSTNTLIFCCEKLMRSILAQPVQEGEIAKNKLKELSKIFVLCIFMVKSNSGNTF